MNNFSQIMTLPYSQASTPSVMSETDEPVPFMDDLQALEKSSYRLSPSLCRQMPARHIY